MHFNINTADIIKLTAKLEKLHRSALPSAVRNTLNDLALEHKKLIPEQAKKGFKNSRNKTFFKALTTVKRASGFDVNSMKAISGLNSGAFSGKTNRIIDNLDAHNRGEDIKTNKLVAQDSVRYGGNRSGRVRKSSFHDKISLHDSSNAFEYSKNKRNKKSGFMAAIFSARKAGKKYMLIKSGVHKKSSGMVYHIGNSTTNMKTRKTNWKISRLYSHKSNKKTHVKKVPFITNAMLSSMKKTNKFYLKNAEFQFKKYM